MLSVQRRLGPLRGLAQAAELAIMFSAHRLAYDFLRAWPRPACKLLPSFCPSRAFRDPLGRSRRPLTPSYELSVPSPVRKRVGAEKDAGGSAQADATLRLISPNRSAPDGSGDRLQGRKRTTCLSCFHSASDLGFDESRTVGAASLDQPRSQQAHGDDLQRKVGMPHVAMRTFCEQRRGGERGPTILK